MKQRMSVLWCPLISRVVSEVLPEKEVTRLLKGWGDNYVDKHRSSLSSNRLFMH